MSPAWMAMLLSVLFCWVTDLTGAPSVTANLDRPQVAVGQPVTLTLVFEELALSRAPSLPAIDGLRFQGSSQSSQVQIINGAVSRQVTFTYQYVPTKTGQITIPSIEFAAGSANLTTQPMTLKVVERDATTENEQEQNKQAFLQLMVPKKEVYLGESFPLEIHLYWINGRDITTPQLRADGFSLSDNPQNTQRRTPQGYNLVIFRFAATAARAGQLTLGPAECSMTLLVPVDSRRADPFDFFGTRARRVPVTLKSEAVEMNVLPLPSDNVPESFNGAVGQFSMNVAAGPTNLAVGDPITISVRISGQGLLDNVNLPDQPQWRDFKTYPPSSAVESEDPLGLSGAKRFEQVVIPQNHEVTALSPLKFSYFDPSAGGYRTLQGPAFPLRVNHAAQVSTPPPAVTNANAEAPPPVDDILHIKARPDGVLAYQTPLLFRPWFLVVQSLPALAWLTLVVLRKRKESLASNPRLRRRRLVQQRIRLDLQELRGLAAAQNSDAFFATLFRMLQEQIGERLDLPASAITESVVDERLTPLGLSEESARTLHELFQTCNQARYAPQKTGQELAELIPNIESILRELQGLKV